MRKLISFSIVSVAALSLLTACPQEDKETKKQLAALQSQLAEQQKENAAKEAKQKREEQEQHENEIYEQARADAKAELEAELTAKAEEKKSQSATQAQATPKAKITKKVVRYPATVVTQSGYGQLSLRGEPSKQGYEVGQVYDGDEVTVIARTNQCEVISNVEGCWVEVQTKQAKGYMFDGYLNREVLSQEEKQNLQGRGQDDACEGCEY